MQTLICWSYIDEVWEKLKKLRLSAKVDFQVVMDHFNNFFLPPLINFLDLNYSQTLNENTTY